jgi:hypothetical protein
MAQKDHRFYSPDEIITDIPTEKQQTTSLFNSPLLSFRACLGNFLLQER